jgi:hypothetical protein
MVTSISVTSVFLRVLCGNNRSWVEHMFFKGDGVKRRNGRLALPVALLLLFLGGWSCKIGNEGFFAVGNLEVVPNPAQQGDVVTFVFNLIVVPERSFTVMASIDDTSHSNQTFRERRDGPFEYTVGDAADLIEQYGLGTHTAAVQVRLNETSDVIGAQSAEFELQSAPASTAAPASSTP